MARTHRLGERSGPDLFPFLSVLACMIGTLILVIIMITTTVLGSRRSVTLVARDSLGENVELRRITSRCGATEL